MDEIRVTSSRDGSSEPCLLWVPEGPGPFPLLTGLHTWSFDRHNQVKALLPRCQERGWALLLPEFRGANLVSNPRVAQTGGSLLARTDVLDAVAAVCAAHPIDERRLLLLGGSGGGHLALLVAADAPTRFAAVSAWVPITDLAAWHGQNPQYTTHIAACCGGAPGDSAAVDAAYRERSSIGRGAELARAVLSIHHGRADRSVPWSHTARLAAEIESHGPPQFYHELFDGGHDLDHDRACAWFARRMAGAGTGHALTR